MTTSNNSDEQSYASLCNSGRKIAPIIYRQIKLDNANLLFSPFSVLMVFMLSQLAAKQDAAEGVEEAEEVLRVPTLDCREIHSALDYFGFICTNEPYNIKSKNKVYLKEACQFAFRCEEVDPHLKTEPEILDFAFRDEALLKMNVWIEKQTSKFVNFFKRADLGDHIRAILINVLRFEAKWPHPLAAFDMNDNFYKSDEEVVKVVNVSVVAYLRYVESEELRAKFLELPFGGYDAMMVFILPDDKDGVAALEDRIDRVLDIQFQGTAYVNVAIPKFKLQSVSDLKQALEEAKLLKPLSSGTAEVGGLLEDERLLAVNKILQASFLEFTEKEVTSEATTSLSAADPPQNVFGANFPPKFFTANHPFLFYIKVQGMFLYVGKVVDPSL